MRQVRLSCHGFKICTSETKAWECQHQRFTTGARLFVTDRIHLALSDYRVEGGQQPRRQPAAARGGGPPARADAHVQQPGPAPGPGLPGPGGRQPRRQHVPAGDPAVVPLLPPRPAAVGAPAAHLGAVLAGLHPAHGPIAQVVSGRSRIKKPPGRTCSRDIFCSGTLSLGVESVYSQTVDV
eukprot:scaffold67497_cov30-Prasinocladus_malaysianus.AAC.2